MNNFTNRRMPPQFKMPEKISFPKISEINMPNGMPLTVINAGNIDVLRLSIVLNAGSRYQEKLLTASTTVNLIIEETKKYKSGKIADMLDFYGSSVEVSIDRDWAVISFYSLKKYFEKTVEIAEQIIKHPTFPEKELEIFKKTNKQQMSIERQKVSGKAREIFINSIFGKNHYYGNFAKPNNFDDINRNMLEDFHNKFYSSNNAFAVLAGKVDDKDISAVYKKFGDKIWGGKNKIETIYKPFDPSRKKIHFYEKKDCLQSALRIGKTMFSKNNSDYLGLATLNTILGGYFGSRLMKNIREEKGYTYGIYSNLVCMRDSGYLVISTEVGNNYVKPTINEIKNEISKLQNEKIKKDELSLVKNYITGELLRAIDGAWELAEVYINLKQSDLNKNYVEQTFNELMETTPEKIQKLAQKYLDFETLTQVIVGKYL